MYQFSLLRWPATLVACLLALPVWATTNQPPASAPVWPRTQQALALTQFVVDILATNPRVRAAEAAVNAAQARERAAGKPLYNPNLDVTAEHAIDDTGTLGLSQTLDWADKQGARADVALSELQAANARLAAVRQEITAGLLSALARVRAAAQLSELAARRVALMEKFASLAGRRRKAGDLGQVDLDLARLAEAQARIQRAQAASTLAEARQALISIVGKNIASLPPLPNTPPQIDPKRINERALVTRLPVLLAQQAEVEAAANRVELNKRQRTPDPTLGLRAGAEGSNPLVGLAFSIPLFVRNDFSAEVDAARAQLRRLQSETDSLYRRARAALTAASARYTAIRQAWSEWQASGRISLEREAEILNRLWRAGELSTADFLVQIRQTLDTEASAESLRNDLWQAWFDWLLAAGQVGAWAGVDMGVAMPATTE